MEIQINFDNLQIETLNMNLEKNSEKPATGKQLWKIQNQVLRNLRIIAVSYTHLRAHETV